MAEANTTRSPNYSYTKTFHKKPYPAIDVKNPANSVAGKVVVVTGGGMGIGLHIALSFAKAGAKAVIITGRTESRLIAAKSLIEAANESTTVRYFIADVVDTDKVNSAFETIKTEIGLIDVLVSNAGYFPDGRTVVDGADPKHIDEFMKAFDVNVRGHLVVTHAFYKTMAPGGTLINVTSGAAHVPYVLNHGPYSASKAASTFLMQYMNVEHGDEIRIFNLHPGVIATAMTEKSKVPNLDDDIDLPGYFCVWLLRPEADFLKGRLLWSNWDVDELIAKKDEIIRNDSLKLGLLGWP